MLRTSFLAIATSSHRIRPTESNQKVFGVLMDWYLGKHIATVVSDLTGFACFITPSTYEILGGPHHVSGRAAAIHFVELANRHYGHAQPSDDHAYPEPGRVRFYLLCFDGLRLIETEAKALAEGTDNYSSLWTEGQQVLAEIQELSNSSIETPQCWEVKGQAENL